MCINPKINEAGQQFACKRCWQCASRVIDDWTGRCIAEAATASAVHSVTLTYGEDLRIGGADHIRAAALTYSDVQRFLKALRSVRTKEAPRGYPVRYFGCGEYGSQKGRAHWHLLLFWQGQVPAGIELEQKRFKFDHWPHGFSYWQPVDTGWQERSLAAVRYVTKYVAKRLQPPEGQEADDEVQFHLAMSKKPPLGEAYFRRLAARYVEQELAPQDFVYTFPGVVYSQGKSGGGKRAGQRRRFLLQGKSRENFLRAYRDLWRARHGARHMPVSEIVEEFEDREAAEDRDYVLRVLEGEKVGLYRLHDTVPERVYRGAVRKPGRDDLRRWMKPERIVFREKLNVWAYSFEGGQSDWYFAPDADEVWGWREKIGRGFRPPAGSYSDLAERPFAPRKSPWD